MSRSLKVEIAAAVNPTNSGKTRVHFAASNRTQIALALRDAGARKGRAARKPKDSPIRATTAPPRRNTRRERSPTATPHG